MLFAGILFTSLLSKKHAATFLDVGQGDATLIQQHPYTILIDTGPDSRILASLGKHLPFWKKSLDLVLITHPHADHFMGLFDLLDHFKIGGVMITDTRVKNQAYKHLIHKIKQSNIPVFIADPRISLILGSSSTLKILDPPPITKAHPSNLNNTSIITKLTTPSQSILLTGDAEFEQEIRLIKAYKQNLRSNILKVGHHGSKSSSTKPFTSLVSPTTAIISCGKKNKFKHPHKEPIDTLESRGAKVYKTFESGDITIHTHIKNK